MKNFVVATVLVAAWALSSVSAQAQFVSNAADIRAIVTQEDLSGIFGELGFSTEPLEVEGVPGPALLVQDESVRFLAISLFCDYIGCRGLQLIAIMEFDAVAQLENINEFNDVSNIGYAVRGQGTTVLFQHRFLTHMGVTRGNIAANIDIYNAQGMFFFGWMSEKLAGGAVSARSYRAPEALSELVDYRPVADRDTQEGAIEAFVRENGLYFNDAAPDQNKIDN